MLTPNDYNGLYSSAQILNQYTAELSSLCSTLLSNQARYLSVQAKTEIPWLCIGAIHCREAAFRFNCHLHNGDPLTARTIHAPGGRPAVGEPPFSWEDSAVDALSRVWKPHYWDLAAALKFLEMYNGFGYYRHGINTPYLWSYTSNYKSGLFVADGTLDMQAISREAGCAALFKTLEQRGMNLGFAP